MITIEMSEINGRLVDEAFALENEAIRNVVLRTLGKIPEYFWHIPSSSSGKYHPEDELGEGGLVLHTWKDVQVAKKLAPMEELAPVELELAIAALILHDTCKSGYPENSGHTVHEHPELAAKLVIDVNADQVAMGPVTDEQRTAFEAEQAAARQIAELIKTHMGHWNESKYSDVVLNKPETKLQKFVHMCDMIAAQKWDGILY